MKKVVVILVLLVFGLNSLVGAKMLPIVAVKLPVQLKEVITKNLNYPKEARIQNMEGDVWMKICVTDESKINVIDISSTNQELGAYVKEELSSLYIDNIDCKVGQVYYLKVKFNLLSNK